MGRPGVKTHKVLAVDLPPRAGECLDPDGGPLLHLRHKSTGVLPFWMDQAPAVMTAMLLRRRAGLGPMGALDSETLPRGGRGLLQWQSLRPPLAPLDAQ